MKKIINNNYVVFLNILIIVYSLYICLSVFKEKAVLTDDLAGFYVLPSVSGSYFSFIYSFLDSQIMAARPVSGVVTGTLAFLSKNNESVYFMGLLFFPLSLMVLYWVAKKMVSKELAGLFTLLYLCSSIGTSIQFSTIMLNSNLATIFFALSIYYAYVRKNTFISSLFFIASVFSYEIFLPLILLNLFLIKENKKRIVFVVLTVGIIVIFRKVIQPNVFANSYQRDEIGKVFELKRMVFVAMCTAKLFFRDFFEGIYKAFLNLRKMNVFEIILSLLITSAVYKIFCNYDFTSKMKDYKKLAIISFISILAGLSIYLFSSYIPTLFGFENRNLGAIRLFYTLFIISGVIYLSVKLKLHSRMISALLAGIAFFFIITNISVKNSWMYASKFNNELFGKLNTALKEHHIETGEICVDYDVFNEIKNNPNLTFREPLFYKDWESPMLCKINGIDPLKIHVHNVETKEGCTVIFQYKNGKMTRTK
ncbi:hypothetical protein IW15_06995 [Chryseobacterium soli]|uniref:Glycosyltransferase RgtA/B/C/D-like domain-containing protein n=1 Tax=Chryseobacterium soli TaxID=445961 RepID=A0A086AA14_9FLAO|nr:hypothetical protein [Chryseobacterium soli]KFF13528.1 hypothetical protein IW15_06995 [Chryseobacterium soli]